MHPSELIATSILLALALTVAAFWFNRGEGGLT